MIFPTDEIKYECKWCGGDFKPYKSTQQVCSPLCAINFNAKKAEEKADKLDEQIKEWKPAVHEKENKGNLQKEINKLARMIDAKFGYLCIDCGKPYGKQVDGAHFHGVGSNNSLRYNLHNIHSAKSDCNFYSDKHKEGYKKGIKSRYGEIYFLTLETLPTVYKEVRLTCNEIVDKLKTVRKLIRTFDTFQFDDGIQAREMFNKIIGIY